ncbi:MAG: hypothetical protein PHT19_02510 [Methylococcus sp.]|nr:hypothetical protein [Methylococcus sp.]
MRTVFVALITLLSFAPAWAITSAERQSVMKEVDRQARAAAEEEEAKENRKARTLLEKNSPGRAKPDVVVFFNLEGNGNNTSTYLALFRDGGKGYVLTATAPVGSGMQRIDQNFVDIGEDEIALRSSEMDDITNDSLYGEEKVYYRWRLANGKLKPLAGVWLKPRGSWIEAKEKAQ